MPMNKIGPTQTDIGIAHVSFSEKKVQKSATDLLEAMKTRVLPCVIGPDGRAYITDGHHWASACARLEKKHPEILGQAQLRLNVLADYQGKSWKDFYLYLYDHGIGYFNKEIRAQYETVDENGRVYIAREKIPEMYQNLPPELLLLKNNPYRSLIGIALEEMGIVAEHSLVDYIEFYVAEEFESQIKDLGIQAKDLEERVSRSHLKKMKDFIGKDASLQLYLMAHLRPDLTPASCMEHLENRINDYRSKKLKLAAISIQGLCPQVTSKIP